MGKFMERQKEKEEVREKDKVRRENIAKYFLDLSKLTFVALVLGSITCTIAGDVDLCVVSAVMVGGIATTVILAKIGNQIFK